MQNQPQTVIRCSSCGQPFNAQVRAVIDASQDPQGKALLLNGQLNMVRCPHCDNPNSIVSALLYHDPSKELLVAYVPMELNLNKDQQERIVGDLMKSLPKDNFKGYMFNPKRSLTMQGLVEMVLEADGITQEMMAAQRERVRLVQQVVDAPDAQLPNLVKEHDSKIDFQFFQTLALMAQRMAESGQMELAKRIVMVQTRIADLSTFGQTMQRQQEAQAEAVEEVAAEIEKLGDGATRQDFMNLAIRYMNDDDRLQALVGIARPAFDQQFFDELTDTISKAPADEREDLETLRDSLGHLTTQVDRQAQMQVQNAVNLLQAMLNTPDIDAIIEDNLPLIDDTFMAVLSANIQEMERRGEANASARLKQIYQRVVTIMQAHMQPELVFVNELLSTGSDDQARQMLNEHAKSFGEPLLEVMDAVGEVLNAQGQELLVKRLSSLRQDAVAVLNQ